MERVTVRNLNDKLGWSGRDYDGRELYIAPGATCSMSERRAKQLLADYPGRFELPGPAEGLSCVTGEDRPPSGPGSDVEVTKDPDDSSATQASIPVEVETQPPVTPPVRVKRGGRRGKHSS